MLLLLLHFLPDSVDIYDGSFCCFLCVVVVIVAAGAGAGAIAISQKKTRIGISYSDDHELIKFANTRIKDDPQLNPKIPFVEGTISYAGPGDNSRTSQLFISYGAHKSLGTQKWVSSLA